MVGAGLSVVMAIVLDGILVLDRLAPRPWLRGGEGVTAAAHPGQRLIVPDAQPTDLVGHYGRDGLTFTPSSRSWATATGFGGPHGIPHRHSTSTPRPLP